MGKNASIVLNIVLIIAVVPLYLLHFSDGKKGNESSSGTAKADSLQKEEKASKGNKALSRKGGDLRVAYVNWDTLMNEYHYVEDMLSELEKEQIRMRKELQGKMRKLEKEYKKLKEESTYMTQSELKKAQRRMQRKQQNLRREQQGLQGKLARKRQKMLKKFFDNVNQYLANYNEENDIDLILRYQRGGDLLYAKNGFEITDTVLNGLNEKYEEEGADKKIPEVSDTGQSPIPQQQGPLSP
jgi:outer membrane protein